MSTRLNRKFHLCFIFFITYFLGACAVAEDIKLKWEWPLDREPQNKLIITIDSVKEDKGFFGFKKSPSIDGYLPDPMIIVGKVVAGDKDIVGSSININLPKVEIENLKVGSLAAIGIYGSAICICIKPVDSKEESLEGWVCSNSGG